MKPSIHVAIALGVVFVIAAAASTSAGVIMKMQTPDGINYLYLEPTLFCSENPDGSVFTFDGEAELFRGYDPSTMTYIEMDKAALAQIGVMVSEMTGQMESLLENLPEEQRAEMEKMLQQANPAAGPADPAPPTKLEPLNKEQKLRGRQAAGYRMMQGKDQKAEVWLASLAELGVSKDDLSVLAAMTAFLESAMKGLDLPSVLSQAHLFNPSHDDFMGIPVKMIEVDSSGKKRATELLEIEKGKIDPAKFGIREGYTRNEAGPIGLPEGVGR